MPRRPQLVAVVLTALVAGASPLRAQEAVDSWRSTLELGFNGASGNSSFAVLRTGGSLTYLHTDQAEFEVAVLYRYGKNDTRVISDDLRGSAKFDWKPDSDFSPFAFVTASRDEIRKIDAKLNGGAGAKWTVLRRGDTRLSFSLAGVLDYENFALEPGSTDPSSEGVFRLSNRIKFDHKFGTGATLQHVTYWQPDASDLSDYDVEMTNTLSTKFLSRLNLALSHEYTHDEVPPPGVKKDDQKFSVVVRVSL